MSNLLFQDNDQLYSIKFSENAYIQMLQHCNESTPYETGGILIGNYSFDQRTANIMQITSAPKNSKRSMSRFHRSSNGLREILDAAWNQGQYYLGEWHYHPNGSSLPSSIDKKQMIDLSHAKQLKCPEPILVVVGRSKNIWNISVRLYVNDQEIVMKIYE